MTEIPQAAVQPDGVLVSQRTGTLGREYQLGDGIVTIGRGADNQIVLDGTRASRHHARVSWTGDGYVVDDLRSTNGTWVNHQRISKPVALREGDAVRFADVPFVFRAASALGVTVLAENLAALSGPVTILFTDVEGSTVMTRQLGDARARELLKRYDTIARDMLNAFGGSEVKNLGDGLMAYFSSTTSAIDCSIRMQRAFAAANVGSEHPIRVRIGLNAGEPIAEENDLFGTAVIVAARLANDADGEEILVTNVVRELVAGGSFQFADRGAMMLQGIEEPVHVYEVQWR